MKATPPFTSHLKKSQSVAGNSTKFCLINIYLSEWGLSRVRQHNACP